MRDRIENLSDQLGLYAQEIADHVQSLKENNNLTPAQAVEILKLATEAQRTDVLHHIDKSLIRIADHFELNSPVTLILDHM